MIRYYSAPRRRDRRAILSEWSLLAALLLCVPVTFLVDRFVYRISSAMLVEGRIVEDEDGVFHASLHDLASHEVDPIWSMGAPVAEFDLTLRVRSYGWPITTSRARAPAEVKYVAFDPNAFPQIVLQSSPGLRQAVEDAMLKRGPQVAIGPVAASSFTWLEGPRVHSPFGWVYASAVWFLVLAFLLIGPLLLFDYFRRVGTAVKESRDMTRRERGLCARCGYDLTGNEFSERCPECGTLV